MALVPLEARLESKERAWEAERKELLHKAEENHKSLKEAEGRCSELEKERSEIKEDRCAICCHFFSFFALPSLVKILQTVQLMHTCLCSVL